MSAVEVFEFAGDNVRVLHHGDEVRFVVADLGRILGYRDAANAARGLRDHHKGYSKISTPGGTQTVLVTTEKGFNRLVLRANTEQAEAVQDWVTDEVLPAIRKTGVYSAEPALSDDEIIHKALTLTAAKVEQLSAQVEALAPKAGAWDEMVAARGDYSVGDASKMLATVGIDLGPQKLFEKLSAIGWTYRMNGGAWRPYQTAVDDGYLLMKPQSHVHPKTGERVMDSPQVRVTMRGVERLRVRLGKLSLVSA